MNKNIRLSEKHGVNPSVQICILCRKPMGVVLHGRLPGDEEAPREVVTLETCDKCRGLTKQGVIFLETEDDKHPPKPTGKLFVLRREAIPKIIKEKELAEDILQQGVAFVPKHDWKELNFDKMIADYEKHKESAGEPEGSQS